MLMAARGEQARAFRRLGYLDLPGGGQVVGISSVAAFRGLPGSAAYSASKAAISTYLEGVRGEVEPAVVVVVGPGAAPAVVDDDPRRVGGVGERGVAVVAVEEGGGGRGEFAHRHAVGDEDIVRAVTVEIEQLLTIR